MFIYFCWCQHSCLHWLEGQQQGKHEFIFGKERIAHLPSRVSDPMEGTAATHSQANTHQTLPKQFIEDLLVEKLDELILQSLSLQLLNLIFSNSSPMVKRQTPHKKTIAQLSVSSSRTKGRQTSLKIPLRLLSSFDGKQEDLDEPLQTVLVHGLHLDITWKSLDCLSCQQKPLKQRGLLASPVIRRSSGRCLYILIVFFKARHISKQAFMIIHGLGLAQVCNNEEHRGASHGNRDLESQAGKKSAISSRRPMNRRLDFPPKDLPTKAIQNRF